MFVVSGAVSDVEVFEDGDLDVVDVVAVPEWFEDGVSEAEDYEVLYGVFAEVVVDAEELVLVGAFVDGVVEEARRIEVGAEGFFDYEASDAVSFVEHSGFAQGIDGALVEGWGES